MSANMFKEYLTSHNIKDIQPIELKESTHTAEEAAKANGVKVSNIVKSLFLISDINKIIALVPGDKRIDIEKLDLELGAKYKMADADTVKHLTGYSIGGVPPFGHKNSFSTYIIEGFDKESELVAAGGSSITVFRVKYDRLVELCDAKELSI